MDYTVATRPMMSPTQSLPQSRMDKMPLYTNYFTFKHGKSDKIFKYAITFSPELPDTARKVRGQILKLVNTVMENNLGIYLFMGTQIFALKSVERFTAKATHEDVEYEITLKMVQELGPCDRERMQFYKIAYNKALKKLKFMEIGRKIFRPKGMIDLSQFNIELMTGFQGSVLQTDKGIFLKLDVAHRVLRKETALDLISKVKQNCRRHEMLKEEVEKALIGSTVLTTYSRRPYRIDSVDFNRSPTSSFECKGEQMEFYAYYKKMYKVDITVMDQPILVHKNPRTGQLCELIPELCLMTGISDQMRSNFTLMRELASKTQTDAGKRIKECSLLFEEIQQNKASYNELAKWDISFSNAPTKTDGLKLYAENLLMGKTGNGSRMAIPLESTPDLDRKIQGEMYSQPSLNLWAIFAEKNDKCSGEFMSLLQSCLKNSKIQSQQPKMVYVNSSRFQDWERCIKETLEGKEGVQLAIFILPSRGKGSPLYADVKKLMLESIPIPSQVICSSTIQRGKNLMSIVSKIVIQIVAKVGGEPWTVSNMPFMDKPTMIVGIDVFHNTKDVRNSLLAFSASLNSTYTKHWSCLKVCPPGKEIQECIAECVSLAIMQFKNLNGIIPLNVICYRDGVGEGQHKAVMTTEVIPILSKLKSLGLDTTVRLMYVLTDKRITTKMFQGDGSGRFTNVLPGTIIDNTITREDAYEFFMVSQKITVGSATPTHYFVLYDSIKEPAVKIYLLTYKLCYMYYNVSGSIRVPAPIQNAHKLASLIGEKVSPRGIPVVPSSKLDKLRSLYYL